MCCAAAPVRDASGQVVGALSISGPASRLARKALETESVRQVASAAEQLSLEIGYRF
jgi:DNA-binding IclR family transcriptional regulator